MKLSRFIPLSVATLLLMPCLIPSGAPVRAGEMSVPQAVAIGPTAPAGDLTPEQIAETADYLMSEATSTVMSLVMTMSYAPGQWKNYSTPVPENFVTLDVKPPPAPSDFPSNGNPDPTPSSESPEPGTLLAGLAGAGAFVYRFYRRRRANADVIDEAVESGESDEVELAM